MPNSWPRTPASIDDCYVYCRAPEQYLFVVNASNDDKDWAWVNAVLQRRGVGRPRPARGPRRPGAAACTLRDLRAAVLRRRPARGHCPAGAQGARHPAGAGRRCRPPPNASRPSSAPSCATATIGGFDLVAARTGYTGETMGFELFVHPDRAVDLWNALLQAGAAAGAKGLRPGGARLAAHRGRAAAVWRRDGRRGRPGRGRRRLRELREDLQAVVRRPARPSSSRRASAPARLPASASWPRAAAWPTMATRWWTTRAASSAR